MSSYTLSLHDALPIFIKALAMSSQTHSSNIQQLLMDAAVEIAVLDGTENAIFRRLLAELQKQSRSEEHTSELQSPCNLVCRLLLEKKKNWQECEGVRS